MKICSTPLTNLCPPQLHAVGGDNRFRFTGFELGALHPRVGREYFTCLKKYASWRSPVRCAWAEGSQGVCACAQERHVFVRRGGGGGFSKESTERTWGRVRCNPCERVQHSEKYELSRSHPFLSLPGLHPDYLVETESLRGGKKQESKSQPPSSCGSVGLADTERTFNRKQNSDYPMRLGIWNLRWDCICNLNDPCPLNQGGLPKLK